MKKSYSLSQHLVVLVLAAMIPFFILSALVIQGLTDYEHTLGERRLRVASRELSTASDQELESTIRTLTVISVFPSLRLNKLSTFHRESMEILKTQPSWKTLIVYSSDGRPLLNSLEKFGSKLPPAVEPQSLRETILSGKPGVGPIVTPTGGVSEFSVHVPLRENGRVLYVLTAVIPASAMQPVVGNLQQLNVGEWTRTLMDSRGTVVARSRTPERFVGQKVLDDGFMNDLAGVGSRFFQDKALDGLPVYIAMYRSKLSGWVSGVSVPENVMNAPRKHSMLVLGVLGFFLLLIFGGGAAVYAQFLLRTIKDAALGASALSDGEVPNIQSSRVKEAEQLRESLLSAGELLKRREKERNELLTQAEAARQDSERANHAKTDFLANMSHELRTPLGVVLGFADILASETLSPKEKAENLQILRRNGQHLLRLIDDILDLSRVEASKLTIETIDFSLPDLISSVISELKPLAQEKNIQLSVCSEGVIPEIIRSDPLRLRQIVFNVVGNAIKFTESGRVDLFLKANGKDLYVTVHDTGIGLSAEQAKKIFTSFTQADSGHTRKYGGAGLGLALSKRIAQLLGGDIQLVESTPGKGSTFEIHVQFEIGADQKVSAKFDYAGDLFAGSLEKVRVLVGEDSPDYITLMSAYLKRAGANVSIAENGTQVLEKLKDQDFDVLLVDIQMPEMDGYEVVKRLRMAHYRGPIIAVTAHALTEQKEKALSMGYSDYVTKPLEPRRLVTTVLRNLK
jgi:signal transduction histidine kinase